MASKGSCDPIDPTVAPPLPASELNDSERLKRPRISGRSREAPACKHCQECTHHESDRPSVDPNPVCVFCFVHNNCEFIGHWAGTCPYENGSAVRPAPPARPKSVAYLNNCPPDIEQKELEELFGTVGPIFEAAVTPPLNDTWPYALASVYYVEKDDAQKAFDKLNGYSIRGHIINVEAEYCRVDPPFLPLA